MTPEQARLAEQISSFSIDDSPAEFTFVDRLAQENGWSRPYAERVIAEYKRFVILAMLSKEQVTPSRSVDEAWHLHLTYTVSYWERMTLLLPRPLHHHPTKGGVAETGRFQDQYARTLKLYEEVFGAAAPSDVWPAPRPRLSSSSKRDDYWHIRKRTAVVLATLTGLSVVAAGCKAADQLDNPWVIVGIVVLAAGVWLITKIRQGGSAWGGPGGSGCGSGCASHVGGCGGDSSVGDSGGGDGGGCGGGGCGGGGD